jgi:hypothetical protein
MADLAHRARIVGENQGDPPLARRRAGELRPAGRTVGGQGDLGGVRPMRLGGELQLRRGLYVGLERNGGRRQAPVELGQDHLHRQIRRAQAARRGRPVRPGRAGEDQLQDRGVGCVERRAATVVAARRKAGRVQHNRWAPGGERAADEGGRPGRLQACHIDRAHAQAAEGQGARQGLNRRHVGRQQVRAVEDDHRQRRTLRRGHGQRVLAAFGQPGGRVGGRRAQARGMGHQLQGAGGVLRPAFAQIEIERGDLLGGRGRQRREARVRPRVAGQQGERNSARAAEGGELLAAVAPVVEPADQPHGHASGVGDDLLGVEVHRHRVAQLGEIGEPQARPVRPELRPGRRQRGEVGVRERQEHQLGRGLPEILGDLGLVERALFPDEQVHRA